jgi:hypothetical protein
VAAPADLMEAASGLKLCCTLLRALGEEKSRRARVTALQVSLRDAYAQHLGDAVRERLTEALAAMPAPPPDEAMVALEAEARGLRRLAFELRGLGGTSQADHALREAARAVVASQALPCIDQARLLEILDDTEGAARVLAQR